MRISTFQFSTAALTLVLAMSGCGGKRDVNTEASKPENPFAMQEAPTPTTPDNAAPAPEPQAEAITGVNVALSAVHTNDYGAGIIATQKVQQMPGVTAEQRIALEKARQAMTTNSSERAEGRLRFVRGRKGESVEQ